MPPGHEPAALTGSEAAGDGDSSRSRAEPSWPRVLATTLELWLKRRLRRTRWTALVLLLAVAAASAVLARHASSAARQRAAGPALSLAATARGEAAGWVAGQVSRSVSVSCDPAMCAALERRGFPGANLVMLRLGELRPGELRSLGSSLIVATATLRSELGRQLATDAPVVMAGFGRGAAGIQVRAIAPARPAAFLDQFRADGQARKATGTELLLNPAVQAAPSARQQLSQGHPDARLIATIGMIAAFHPVRLVSFGGASPGAAAGVPLRSLVLYGVTHGVTAGTAFLGSLRALLLAQRPSYRPAGIRIVRLATGQDALHIWFAAPEPLGLLDASQPLVKISPP